MFRRTFLAAALAAGTVMPVSAHHDGDTFANAGITVSHAYTVAGSATAHAIEVFVTIENASDTAVTLTAAEIDFAAPGVFQAPTVDDQGVLAVRDIAAVEIAAGQTLTMQPGGIHIVFNDVQQPLAPGDHFHAHLDFADLGEIEIEVEVERADEQEHQHDDLG
ncbi:copper chaperone PCu(A)C [Roseivivax isoporae]|uniref:Copper chaperone PCu(A)C n=1 Tax=Roseivivax isoporae LMG 25204 TaxID=1449351 RepID=X7F6N5_9RHOB|nr:copper chaperone PCu(A)C [Roseivivax isoporae]ETX28460.1 hypothetical protein RISW2_07060 [Roseivivax isoporae LMG 25204]